MTEEKNLELIVSSIKKSIMDSVILSPNKDYLILHKKTTGGQKV